MLCSKCVSDLDLARGLEVKVQQDIVVAFAGCKSGKGKREKSKLFHISVRKFELVLQRLFRYTTGLRTQLVILFQLPQISPILSTKRRLCLLPLNENNMLEL